MHKKKETNLSLFFLINSNSREIVIGVGKGNCGTREWRGNGGCARERKNNKVCYSHDPENHAIL